MLASKSLCPSVARISRPACASSTRPNAASRRTLLQVRAIGNVNDPEKTKANKEKKAQDSEWAEPKNKNPLEKKPIIRGDPGKAAESGGNPADGVKDAVEGATEKAKEAIEGVKKNVAG